ncbi:ornithine cyclodeaminase [Roseibacterium sp. SDUM158016]|uniref:ornithine cyclodeaminase family protein n=1 Tax=Roseicyclus sediminis TaxID=2980997 RepID=UPI0021D3CBD9|nr:ornithine cyclodeaminase [Roseibacterium sp. SDUM158016]MCU4652359.1 ornithine cyclodeaminase [Roseibacterium sp. SDUM158016]
MSVVIVAAEAEARLDWLALTDALEAGHHLPKAEIGDTFLYRGGDTLLSRAAWIDGMGMLVKTATIFPGNATRGAAAINGGVTLYSDADGTLEAILDFHLVTKWKTAGDSLLAARKLARPDSGTILIVGAGTVARSLREAYGAAFPQARFRIWNRSPDPAMRLAAQFPDTEAVQDLEGAVGAADIVTCATMSTTPVIQGAWLRPGTHVDLIGAYRPDMREADDDVLRRGRLFVDARDTTLGHIGEVKIPLEAGVIAEPDVLGDYYDLSGEVFARTSDDEITVFKNGGGAHLDLMCARYILGAVQSG